MMYSKPTWHDRRGYPPAPFPYRDTPRPMPSSTLSSNTPQYQQPQYPLQQIHNDREVRHNKRSRSKRRQHKKRKRRMQRRHIAINMPIFNKRKAILITNSVLLALFWITLACLITFGTFMYLYVFNSDDATPTEEPVANVSVPLAARTFDGSFALLTINGSIANYQPAFNDPSSEEYVELADAIEESLDDIYMPIENAAYVGSAVTGFQEGSIIANFMVMFDVRENSSIDLETELKLTLIDAIEGGRPASSNLLLGADRDSVVLMPREAGQLTSTPSTNQATPTPDEVIIDPLCGNANIRLDQAYMKQRLRSHGYPGLNANISCIWLITSPQYTTIHVEFTDFGTTTESEYIRIGNGLNTTDMTSLLFEYSGNQIPAGVFKSTENKLWIQFLGSIDSRGFSLNIEYHIDCGGDVVLSTESEDITSLGYPYGLSVPFHCLWLIVSPSETKMVATINDFDVIFPTDWFRIGNGHSESNSNSIIFEHSGQGVETTQFISSSNEMWISYNSPDGTTQRGFNVTISFGPLYECGTTSHVSSSEAEYSNVHWPWLVSLVADEDVIHNFSCNAIIIGEHWLLTTAKCLIDFSSEKFLMARINGSTNGILLEVDDFLIHPGFNSASNTDLAVVRLSTNISFSEHVRHICFPMTHTPYERCFIIGLEMTIPIGTEIDQKMLENFENCMGIDPNEFCVELPEDVELNLQEAQQTQLICTNADGYWDSVGIVSNVSSSPMNDQILTYTNISTSVVWIQDAIANWNQYDTIKVTCGQKVYQLDIYTENQILSSPNYPSNYPLYITCEWTIVAPENYRVLLHIQDFSTQFCCDLVTLSDVDSSLVLSGDIEREYLISTGNQVDVIFHTDKFTTERGFMISIEAILENDGAAYREL